MGILSDITVFDFETSGLSAEKERVIEMAAIRCVNGEIVSQFQTLVSHPGLILEPKITELTGITQDQMEQGMDETLAFKILRNMMGGSLLVAHNAAFDLAFLHHAMQRLAGKTYSNHFIDTMTISRERHTFPHKLTDMTARYGIVLEGAHRALNDVIGCWELLKALDAEEPVDQWMNRLGYLRKYGPPSWTPAYAEVFGTDNRYEPRSAG